MDHSKMYALLVLLASSSSLVYGFGLHEFRLRGLEEPDVLDLYAEDINEKWITQPLDHFNPRDNRTWSMRYFENTGHSAEGGPIFIMLGGEWEISDKYLMSGLMYDIGVTHRAAMYYTEHRYYGKSRPTEDTSEENLQYLNVDQALADVAYFIETTKTKLGKENVKVIVFGGSYAGNMATWARLKYPHLIQGALASSAPIRAKLDFHEYYEIVDRSLRRYDEQCAVNVKVAIDSVEELLAVDGGAEKLKSYFNLCKVPNVKDPISVSHLMSAFSEKFAGIVQYNKNPNDGRSTIGLSCNNMTSIHLGSPLQRLARLMSKKDCLDVDYKSFVSTYTNVTWEVKSIMRLWVYQTCTEYGYYSTSDSEDSIFGKNIPLDYYLNICADLYGNYYNGEYLKSRVRRTNLVYGGSRPDLSNVIFTNGDVDPWHTLSVLEDLNESSPAIVIEGISHCQDLLNDLPTDQPVLTKARETVRKIVGKWITSR